MLGRRYAKRLVELGAELIAIILAVLFPLSVSSSGHYLQDANGVPFLIVGDTAWEAPAEMTLTDWRTYLDTRVSQGFNTVLVQITNPAVYTPVEQSPFALQMGGVGGGAAALPFSKNISGGTWDGDRTFAHHDADFSQPNDAYHSWVAQMFDEAAARGVLVIATPLYLGFNLGAGDGWWLTLTNAGNTQTVAFNFGKYLAQGNGGSFAGFKLKKNVIWEDGVDMTPSVEAGATAEGTLRYEQIILGMQSGGATQLRSGHWKHDFLSTDDSRLAQYMGLNAVYTHGSLAGGNTLGPTYGRARIAYAHSPALPAYLTETSYEPSCAADIQVATNASDSRRFYWQANLAGASGGLFGSNLIWTSSTATAWTPSTAYTTGQFRANGGFVYTASIGGTSASSGGPTTSAASITDGSVTWSCVTGNWKTSLTSAHAADFARMSTFMQSLPWHRLQPSGLGGMKTLVTSGAGTCITLASPGDSEVGGDDCVTAAATSTGESLVAYVPPAHTGSITVDLTAMAAGSTARSRWFDPTAGTYASIGYFAAIGSLTVTPPATNGAGGTDFVLVLDAPTVRAPRRHNRRPGGP